MSPIGRAVRPPRGERGGERGRNGSRRQKKKSMVFGWDGAGRGVGAARRGDPLVHALAERGTV